MITIHFRGLIVLTEATSGPGPGRKEENIYKKRETYNLKYTPSECSVCVCVRDNVKEEKGGGLER